MPSDLVGAYQGLKRLSGLQRQALEMDDLDAFWRFSDEREAAFAALQGLEGQVGSLSDADRALVAELIPAILAADAVIEKRLGELTKETQGEIGRLKTGLSALQSYAVEREHEAFFIDRSS